LFRWFWALLAAPFFFARMFFRRALHSRIVYPQPPRVDRRFFSEHNADIEMITARFHGATLAAAKSGLVQRATLGEDKANYGCR
jgi:hypothetical protein